MALSSISTFVYTQLLPLSSLSSFSRPLSGRTVLPTGRNTVLGLEAAKHLASLGAARLIITSRSAAPAAPGLGKIEAAGRGKVGRVECWEVELGRFGSVKALAERFAREGGGTLDLLVLNAGVWMPQWQQTPHGCEETLQVNHLSGAWLALRLLPFLLAAEAQPPTPRVVVVSSGLHLFLKDVPEAGVGESLLRKLNEREYSIGKLAGRYPLTKLFDVLFTQALSERLPPATALSVNVVHPGFCRSELGRHRRAWGLWLFTLLLARSTEMGARTLVWTAVSERLDGLSGKYSAGCGVSTPSKLVQSARGREVKELLWVSDEFGRWVLRKLTTFGKADGHTRPSWHWWTPRCRGSSRSLWCEPEDAARTRRDEVIRWQPGRYCLL
ncbi:NAD(P)-binding protein [Calocera cornea HHB12733]|uniref:NAD(P)-binding protein n=1 Tax=Calocera cornea HHB12733 TaxID=1353952 RepID=A0A165JMP3_9BASI|nr:NAD(P)-binding protein [Calocera cornea HHB12733]